MYNKAGGKVLRGLVNRRAEEAKLFDTAGPATSEERKDSVFAKLFNSNRCSHFSVKNRHYRREVF